MTRRQFAAGAFLVSAPATAVEPSPVTLRGKLTQQPGQPSRLTMQDRKTVPLDGDDQTQGILRDPRLNNADLEINGHTTPGGTFRILPIHKRAIYVHQGGKRLFVTYWCDVCAIRTYSPGICWCCQEDTALDLREKLDN